MNWLGFTAFLLLLFGLPLASHLAIYRLHRRLRAGGQRTTGKIISQRSPATRYGTRGIPIATVRFVTLAGETIRGESAGDKHLADAHIGDEIEVIYEAAAPVTFVFERHAEAAFDCGFVWFILVLAGLLTWLVIASPSGCVRRPVRQLSQSTAASP